MKPDKRRKLTPEAVRYIRANPKGKTFEQLGNMFGVKKLTAWKCFHRYTYNHIE